MAKRLLLSSILALAVALTAAPAIAATTGTIPVLSVHGARIYLGSKLWTPRGVTVSGLEHDGLERLSSKPGEPSWKLFVQPDQAQIIAATTAWHANAIRLQVSQDMVAAGYFPAFRAELRAEVTLAERYGMVVVINDQTQWDLGGQGDTVTARTYTFWKIISRLYGHDPRVVFDLLNEPHGGGDYDGAAWHRTFEPLVALIRKVSSNQVWAEGPDGAGTLASIRGHLLTGGNIVYEFHHPPHAFTSVANARQIWEADFGWLTPTHPVVNGEWSDWAADRGECWTDPSYVPLYLDYLTAHHVGMTIWSLGYDGGSDSGYPTGYTGPGVLTRGSYTTPSVIGPDWSCTNGLGESAGTLLQSWFAKEAS